MGEHALSFDRLNKQVTIQQVAEQMLGIKLMAHKDGLRACCPISQSTDPRHFVVTPSVNRYVCFCPECKKFPKRGGDAIELVRRMRRFDGPLPAANEIAKHFGLIGTQQAQEPPKESNPEGTGRFDALAYRKRLQPNHEALKDCGVSGETIKAWGGGYCATGALGGRLSMPLCDIEGTIMGFVGIALKGESPDLKYPKGLIVPFFFGLHMVTEERDLHLVWHPIDALRYSEDGIENVIASLTPITRDALTNLTDVMDAKGITGLETH